MSFRTKFTAIAGALLGGLLALAGGAGPASAHSRHDHAVTSRHELVQVPVAFAGYHLPKSTADLKSNETRRRAQTQITAADLGTGAPGAPQPFHTGNWCCGSITCHAGVEAGPIPLVQHVGAGKKFDLPPILPMAKSGWGGIERPPRGESTL
jgi:hypothetical protein